MPTYAAAAAGAVILSTAVLIFIFMKRKLLNIWTLISIAAASLISIAAFPFLFRLISQTGGESQNSIPLLTAVLLTCVAVLLLALLFSILIMVLLPKPRNVPAAEGEQPVEGGTPVAVAATDNYLEQIFDRRMNENSRETSNSAENVEKAENNLEISVDSSENIDKMGIENNVQTATAMSIEGCIEAAFRQKESGNAEGAIQSFMEALEKKPGKDLTFWIILDICVLYKSFGQTELAYDILNSYYERFSEVMDASVKEEIEYNLFDIYA